MSKPDLKNKRLNILSVAQLSAIPWLVHGFSTRNGGVSRLHGKSQLNLGFTKDDSKSAVESNRANFLTQLNAVNSKYKPWPLVTLRQIHSDVIHFVEAPPESQLVGDGLITAIPEFLLGIQTADCIPIILVDPKRRAVGVFHAGWRGTLKRIVEKGVGAMQLHFGTMARDLKAAIGPGIHGCCYEVGQEVRDRFESQFTYGAKLFREVEEFNEVREKYPMLFLTARAPGHSILPTKIYLDLVEANRQQLLSVGVPAKNIEASPLCTACNRDRLFSYRAEKGKTGRMMAVAGIRN